MKFAKIFTLLLCCSMLSFYSCNEKAEVKQPEKETVKPLQVPNSQSANAPALNASNEPARNTSGVWHYTCSNGCAGGAGAAGACANCGNSLVHNQAYHSTTTQTNPQTTTPPEPSQNAAGIWHYTCGNGCAGGGGSAGPCGTCGTTLAHNSAYHN